LGRAGRKNSGSGGKRAYACQSGSLLRISNAYGRLAASAARIENEQKETRIGARIALMIVSRLDRSPFCRGSKRQPLEIHFRLSIHIASRTRPALIWEPWPDVQRMDLSIRTNPGPDDRTAAENLWEQTFTHSDQMPTNCVALVSRYPKCRTTIFTSGAVERLCSTTMEWT